MRRKILKYIFTIFFVVFGQKVLANKGLEDNDKKANPKAVQKALDSKNTPKNVDLKETAALLSSKSEPKNFKEKRKIANLKNFSCSETYTDEFSYGYIQLGSECDSSESLCIGFYRVERNRCEKTDLIRYYCDPLSSALYSTKTIKCKKGCQFEGLSATCIK